MATNLAIDTAAVEELMRLGSFASKREAVDARARGSVASPGVSTILFGAVDFSIARLCGPDAAWHQHRHQRR